MRKPFVAGNWKMNGSSSSIKQLLDNILSKTKTFSSIDIALFPASVYLQQVQTALTGSHITWGIQNVSSYKQGAYTGEIAASMLHDFSCKYALMGHSERRCLYSELELDQLILDRIIAEKYYMAIREGLIPIVCIGESQEEYVLGKTEELICRLLDLLIERQGVKALSQSILVYEPVWAIGTGQTATPGWAQEVHYFMRERIARHDMETAVSLRILYGGSVKANNIAPLLAMPDVDGGLIGGASLDADEFVNICQAAQAQTSG